MLAGNLYGLKKAITVGCYTQFSKEDLGHDTIMKFEEMAKYILNQRYLTGDDICYLDFYLYELLQLAAFTTNGKIFQEYPHLDHYQFRMSQLPRLKEYLNSRECQAVPFNMKFANINNWDQKKQKAI